MPKTIWVTHTLYEKNANDGIEHFTTKAALALAVETNEAVGGTVQVYKCTPVKHEVYTEAVSISLEGDPDGR